MIELNDTKIAASYNFQHLSPSIS